MRVFDTACLLVFSVFSFTKQISSTVLLEEKTDTVAVITYEKIVPRTPCLMEPVPCTPLPCNIVEIPQKTVEKSHTDVPSIAKEGEAAHDSVARHGSVKPHVAPGPIRCKDCDAQH